MENDDSTQSSCYAVKLSIDRGDEAKEDNIVRLLFSELDGLSINLSDSGVDDIKDIFDKIFDVIIEKKTRIEFSLDDDQNDLYSQVTEDIIKQLNSEILDSMKNFTKIWSLSEQSNQTDKL